jgi:hypothetical protein
MKNQLTKETEEELRSQLSHIILPKRKPYRKLERSSSSENKEDESLKNFNEYLSKIRYDKQQEIQSKTAIEQIEDEFHHPVFDSDSPLTMGSSVSEEDGDDLEEEEEVLSTMNHSRPISTFRKYKKLTYKEVERSLDFYEDEENKYLNELDILITFLKGQTQLYSMSQYLTQQKINILTIPSFVFSIVVTVLAPLIHDYVWSGILISALTASIASLFACVRFYELDASCTTYLYLTNQYNKMQISLETISNSMVIGTGSLRGIVEWKEVMEKIKEVENRITELNSNSILPPEEVKLLIPIISHVNIFSFIKKMKIMKKNKISKYREIKNEIRFILNQWDQYSYQNEFPQVDYEPIESSHSSTSSSKAIECIDVPEEKNHIPEPIWKDSDESKKKKEKISFQEQHPWKKKRHQMMREKHRMSYLLKKKSEIRKDLNYYRTAYSYIDEIFTREMNIADHTSYWWVSIRWFLGIQPNSLPRNNPVVDRYLEFIFIPSHSSYYNVLEFNKNKEKHVSKHSSLPKNNISNHFVSEEDFDIV